MPASLAHDRLVDQGLELLGELAIGRYVLGGNDRHQFLPRVNDQPRGRVAGPLSAIIDRLFDLHPVTKRNYYHPDMHGSWSLKAVLPTVAPDLRHSELEIVSVGSEAETAFLEMIDAGTGEERRRELREALLRYCELDTLALFCYKGKI